MNALEISVQHLAKLYSTERSVFVLDVRQPWEVEKVSLKGAINIPLEEVASRQDNLPKDQPIYVLCHHGVRSLKVALWLQQEGYEAYSVRGGIDAWAREVDASVGFY